MFGFFDTPFGSNTGFGFNFYGYGASVDLSKASPRMHAFLSASSRVPAFMTTGFAGVTGAIGLLPTAQASDDTEKEGCYLLKTAYIQAANATGTVAKVFYGGNRHAFSEKRFLEAMTNVTEKLHAGMCGAQEYVISEESLPSFASRYWENVIACNSSFSDFLYGVQHKANMTLAAGALELMSQTNQTGQGMLDCAVGFYNEAIEFFEEDEIRRTHNTFALLFSLAAAIVASLVGTLVLIGVMVFALSLFERIKKHRKKQLDNKREGEGAPENLVGEESVEMVSIGGAIVPRSGIATDGSGTLPSAAQRYLQGVEAEAPSAGAASSSLAVVPFCSPSEGLVSLCSSALHAGSRELMESGAAGEEDGNRSERSYTSLD
jgi:hypothetical protein